MGGACTQCGCNDNAEIKTQEQVEVSNVGANKLANSNSNRYIERQSNATTAGGYNQKNYVSYQ